MYENVMKFLNDYEDLIETNMKERKRKMKKTLSKILSAGRLKKRVLFEKQKILAHEINHLDKKIKRIRMAKEQIKKGYTDEAKELLEEYIESIPPVVIFSGVIAPLSNSVLSQAQKLQEEL